MPHIQIYKNIQLIHHFTIIHYYIIHMQDPETHVFSTYMDWAVVHGVTKLTEMKDTYQYIPIIAVIQAMLHNRVLYEEVKVA